MRAEAFVCVDVPVLRVDVPVLRVQGRFAAAMHVCGLKLLVREALSY